MSEEVVQGEVAEVDEKAAMLEAYKAELAGSAESDVDSVEEAMAKHDPNAKMRRDLAEIGELDDKPATVKAEPAETAEDPDESALAKALRDREKLQAKRREAMADADNLRADVERRSRELTLFQENLNAQAKALAELKADPAKALKALGIDPEEFIYSLAAQDTAELAKVREQKAKEQKLSELEKFREQYLKDQDEARARAETEKLVAHRQTVLQEFQSYTAPEAAPHIAALTDAGIYTKDFIVAWGDQVAQEYRAKTVSPENPRGEEASVKDIAEYLELKAKERYNAIIARKDSANSAKVQASKPEPRTLNTATSQERRTLTANVSPDLSDEERRAAANAAVNAAVKAAESRRKPAQT